MAARVPSPREALSGILRAALTCPASLAPDSFDLVARALHVAPDSEAIGELACSALAALLYGRPDLVEDSLLDRLAGLLRAAPLPDGMTGQIVTLWEYVATSPVAPRAWSLLEALVRDERLAASTRERLLPLVSAFVQWREDLVGLDGVLALAESPALATHRPFLLDHGVERFVFCAPETFTIERLDRLARLFGHLPRARYVLHALAARPGLAPDVRAWLARQLAGRFPFHETAAALLTGRPVTLLVVLNAGMGQGDDVVRLAPLLQALLDVNPALAISLITQRPYLYDHPRVLPIAIGDEAATQAALGESLDGVLEFFQPEWPEFTFRADLHAALEQACTRRRPAFVVKGDLGRACQGRAGGRSQFLHQTVELGGRDIAGPCGLDQVAGPTIYDPSRRLLAELGLPQRAAEEPPGRPSLLTGIPSADAERVWRELIAPHAAPTGRPVALVNPFGGSGPTKGFLEQDALLAAELAGLVAEGYLVVALPNGTPWGRRSALLRVQSLLAPDVLPYSRVAPDPAEPDEAARLGLTERPALKSADRIMRLFKYFAAYADLVVTVEGWLGHLAYHLGRPFRLFLAAGSFSPDWYPHGRGHAQRLVPALSPLARAAYPASALLGADEPPPLPHRPRKPLLGLALAGLGRAGGSEALAPLRRALASPDADVRTWAVAALGRVEPVDHQKVELLAALEDRSPTVVREAAEALVRGHVDCSRELGARYRDLLQAHADATRQDWDAVVHVGPAALPALFHAARSEIYDVRRGARVTLRRILSPYLPSLRGPERAPESGTGRGGDPPHA